MDDAFHSQPFQTRAPHLFDECVAVHVVAVLQTDEVLPFFRAGEIVHHEDVVHAAAVQFPDNRAADESGSAGDDEHVRSLPRV